MEDEELQKIVTNMVAAGDSEADINLVIDHYDSLKKKGHVEEAPTTPNLPTDNSLANTNYLGKAMKEGVNAVVGEGLKFLGHSAEKFGRAYLPESMQHPSPFVEAGTAVEDWTAKHFPTSQALDESFGGKVAGTLGAVSGIAALGVLTGGESVAAEGTGIGAKLLAGGTKLLTNIATPAGFVGGAMIGVPEYEAAKAAGKTDDEAYNTLVKNYLVGTAAALPIESSLMRLNTWAGGTIAKQIGVGGLQSAITGGTLTALTNSIAKSDYDPDRDVFWGVVENMATMGAVGMLLPAIGGAMKSATPENRAKIEKKLADIEAKAHATKLAEESLPSTGDTAIDAAIDADAKLTPNQLKIIGDKKVAELAKDEAIRLAEERQKRIDEIEGDLEKHDVTLEKNTKKIEEKPEPETGSKPTPEGTLLPDQKTELEAELGKLKEEHAKGTFIEPTADPHQEALDKISALADAMKEPDADHEMLYRQLQEAKSAAAKLAPEPRPKGNKALDEALGIAKSSKSVIMTPGEAIKKQITDFYRGVKEGVERGTELKNKMLEKVQEYLKGDRPREGVFGDETKRVPFTNQQVSSILTKVRKTNPSSPGSISRLSDYVNKVASDADYAAKLDEAYQLQKRIKSKRSASKTWRENDAISEFSKVDPDEVNIDKYLDNAREIARSFRPVTDRVVLDISKTFDYIRSTDTEMNAANEKKAAERVERETAKVQGAADKLGVSFEEAQQVLEGEKELSDKNKQLEAHELMRETARAAKDDVDSYDDAGLSETNKKTVGHLKSADLDLLSPSQLKNYTQVVDRILTNDDFGGAERVGTILDGAKEFRTLQEKMKDANIIGLSVPETLYAEQTSNVSQRILDLTRISTEASNFQLYMGLKGFSDGWTRADRLSVEAIDALKQMQEANKQKGLVPTLKRLAFMNVDVPGFTDESIYRQGIAATLMRHPRGEDPAPYLAKSKAMVEASIGVLEERGEVKDAAAQRALYDKFKGATTPDEVKAILKQVDPHGAAIVDKLIELHKPVGERKAEVQEGYFNKKLSFEENYAGPVKWLSDQVAKGADDLGIGGSYNNKIPRVKERLTSLDRNYDVRKDATLDFNLHYNSMNSLRADILHNETIAHRVQIRENLSKKEDMLKIFGKKAGDAESAKKANRLYKDTFGEDGVYFSYENATMNGIPTKAADKWVNKYILEPLVKIGHLRVFSGPVQAVKQLTVLSNAAIRLGSDAHLLPVREYFAAAEARRELLKDQTVSRRGEQKSSVTIGEGDEASKSLGAGASKVGQALQRNYEGIAGVKPLVWGDKTAAQISFLGFYKQYLKKQGVKFSSFREELGHQNEPARREAHAYAKQMVDVLQGASNPLEQSSFFRNKKVMAKAAKALLVPFGQFQAQTHSRMYGSARTIITGNSRQRAEAFRDLTGSVVESAVYNSFGLANKAAQIALGTVIAQAVGIPVDPRDWKKQWENAVGRFKTQLLVDNTPMVLGSPGEAVWIALINAASNRLLGYDDPHYKPTEANRAVKLGRELLGDNPNPFYKYTPPSQAPWQTAIDLGGAYGVGITGLEDTYEATSEALTNEKPGDERPLSDKQARFAAFVGLLQVANFAGKFPTDFLRPVDNVLKKQRPQGKPSNYKELPRK